MSDSEPTLDIPRLNDESLPKLEELGDSTSSVSRSTALIKKAKQKRKGSIKVKGRGKSPSKGRLLKNKERDARAAEAIAAAGGEAGLEMLAVEPELDNSREEQSDDEKEKLSTRSRNAGENTARGSLNNLPMERAAARGGAGAEPVRQVAPQERKYADTVSVIPRYMSRLAHKSRPVEVTFSPDGRSVASGCDDGCVMSFDVQTGDVQQSWSEHSTSIFSLAYSCDGALASSAGSSVCVYHPSSGEVLHTFEGHKEEVTCLAYSDDGKRLATGSLDRTVKVWDTAKAKLSVSLERHVGSVWSVAFAPGSSASHEMMFLATASKDFTVRIWRLVGNTATQVHLFEHSDMVSCVAFCPTADLIASGSWDHTVLVHDYKTGRLVHTLRGHATNVETVGFSADGLLLASSAAAPAVGQDQKQASIESKNSRRTDQDDNAVCIWDTQTGMELVALSIHSERVTHVAFSPLEPDIVASASQDGTVAISNARTGALLQHLQHHHPVAWVSWSPDGDMLASACDDHTVRVWRPDTSCLLHTFNEHTDRVYGLTLSPNSQTLVSSCDDGTVKVFSTVTAECMLTVSEHSEAVWYLSFAPDGDTLCSASDTSAKVWRPSSGDLVQSFDDHRGKLTCAAFNGELLATVAEDNVVKVWMAQSGRLLHQFQGHMDTVTLLAFNPQSSLLASGAEDKSVQVWDLNAGSLVSTQGHMGRLRALVFAPDGEILASGAKDHVVRIFSALTGELFFSIDGHAGTVNLLAFSPDGNYLASGSYDKTVKVWDLRNTASTSEVVLSCSFERHKHYITSLVFAPDASSLATGSWDHTVCLFDYKTGELLNQFTSHTSTVTGVAFSADASLLCTGSWDHSVRLWDPVARQPSFTDARRVLFMDLAQLLHQQQSAMPLARLSAKASAVTVQDRIAHAKFVKSMIQRFPCVVNSTDFDGRSLLHHACLQGRADLVQLLLASPYATAILQKCRTAFQPVGEIDGEKETKTRGETVLDVCLRVGADDCLQLILDHIPRMVPFINREQLTAALPRLLRSRPRMALGLLRNLGLEQASPMVLQGLRPVDAGTANALFDNSLLSTRIPSHGVATTGLWPQYIDTFHSGRFAAATQLMAGPDFNSEDSAARSPSGGAVNESDMFALMENIQPRGQLVSPRVLGLPDLPAKRGKDSALAIIVAMSGSSDDANGGWKSRALRLAKPQGNADSGLPQSEHATPLMIELLSTPIMRQLLEFKWEQFGRRHFFIRCLLFFVFLTMFCVSTLLPRLNNDLGGLFSDGSVTAIVRGLVDLVTLLLALIMLGLELRQYKAQGRHSYFRVGMAHRAELVSYLLVVAVAVCRIVENVTDSDSSRMDDVVDSLEAVAALFLWLKLLELAKQLNVAGPFVRMLYEVFRRVSVFFVVLLVLVLGFSHTFFLLFRGGGAQVGHKLGSWEVLIKVYQALLGDYNQITEFFSDASQPWLAIVVFVIFSLMISLVLLNLLVALMLDVYQGLRSQVQGEWLKERARAVVQLESSLTAADIADNRHSWFPRWVHVLCPGDEFNETRTVGPRVDSGLKQRPTAGGSKPGTLRGLPSNAALEKASLRETVSQLPSHPQVGPGLLGAGVAVGEELDSRMDAMESKIDQMMMIVKGLHSKEQKREQAEQRSRSSAKLGSSSGSLRSSAAVIRQRRSMLRRSATMDKKRFAIKTGQQ